MEDYEPIKVLGEGSYGKVYLMKKLITKELVCSKVVKLKNASIKDQELCKAEVNLLKRMSHPNIVGYLDSFIHKNCLCIIMEYCDSGDLRERVTKANGMLFSESKIMTWFVQIAMGLHFMHSNRVLHRDVKSENVFILSSGRMVLGDLGISKVLSSTTDFAKTQLGTPYYMSPEIFKGQPYNHKSDVWALGIVLYELVTLKRAFDANSMTNLSHKILKGKYPPIDITYSKPLKGLVKDLLAANPNSRPDVEQILRMPFMRNYLHQFVADFQVQANLKPQTAVQKKAFNSLSLQLMGIGMGPLFSAPTSFSPKVSESDEDSSDPDTENIPTKDSINRINISLQNNNHNAKTKRLQLEQEEEKLYAAEMALTKLRQKTNEWRRRQSVSPISKPSIDNKNLENAVDTSECLKVNDSMIPDSSENKFKSLSGAIFRPSVLFTKLGIHRSAPGQSPTSSEQNLSAPSPPERKRNSFVQEQRRLSSFSSHVCNARSPKSTPILKVLSDKIAPRSRETHLEDESERARHETKRRSSIERYTRSASPPPSVERKISGSSSCHNEPTKAPPFQGESRHRASVVRRLSIASNQPLSLLTDPLKAVASGLFSTDENEREFMDFLKKRAQLHEKSPEIDGSLRCQEDILVERLAMAEAQCRALTKDLMQARSSHHPPSSPLNSSDEAELDSTPTWLLQSNLPDTEDTLCPKGMMQDRAAYLRQKCIDGLGQTTFLQAYQGLQTLMNEQDGYLEIKGMMYDGADDKQVEAAICILIGKDKLEYWNLMDQLLLLEES